MTTLRLLVPPCLSKVNVQANLLFSQKKCGGKAWHGMADESLAAIRLARLKVSAQPVAEGFFGDVAGGEVERHYGGFGLRDG